MLRSIPPAEELVHHARPDAPIPGPDGELLTLELPEGLEVDDPWAGIEDEVADEDDPVGRLRRGDGGRDALARA